MASSPGDLDAAGPARKPCETPIQMVKPLLSSDGLAFARNPHGGRGVVTTKFRGSLCALVDTRYRSRGQGGFGLLESIVSIALVSGVVLTLAAGLLTTVRSSTSAKDTQLVDAALSAYAESFKGQSLGTGCPSQLDPSFPAPEPGWFTDPDSSVTSYGVTEVQGWDYSDPGDPWKTCVGGLPASTAHRLTVEVTVEASDGARTASGQVVVRDEP